MSEGRRRKSPLTAASSSSNEENGNGPEPMDETSDMKVDSGKVESAPEASTATSAAGEDAGLERASKRQKQEGDQEPSGSDGGESELAGRPSRRAKDQARDKMNSPAPGSTPTAASSASTAAGSAPASADKKKKKKKKKAKRAQYCYCGEDSETPFMVQCDGACSKWYHGSCLGMMTEAEVSDIWLCANCGGPAYDPVKVTAAREAATKEAVSTPLKAPKPADSTAKANSSGELEAKTSPNKSAPKDTNTNSSTNNPKSRSLQGPANPTASNGAARQPPAPPVSYPKTTQPPGGSRGGYGTTPGHAVYPAPPTPAEWRQDGQPPEAAGLNADDVSSINAGDRGTQLERGDEIILHCVMPGCEKERSPFSKYCSSDCASRNGMAAQVTLTRLRGLPGWTEDNASKAKESDALLLELEERMEAQALNRLKQVEEAHERLLIDIENVAEDADDKPGVSSSPETGDAAPVPSTPASASGHSESASTSPPAATAPSAEGHSSTTPNAATTPVPPAEQASATAEASSGNGVAPDSSAATAEATNDSKEAAPAASGTTDATSASNDTSSATTAAAAEPTPMETDAPSNSGKAPSDKTDRKPGSTEPLDCPTCGMSIPGKSYARHQETCYARNAGQVYAADPKLFGPSVDSDLYCNYNDKDPKAPKSNGVFCALLKVSCPYHGDHRFRKKVTADSPCGFRNPETKERCTLIRRNCNQHNGWEQAAAGQLKQERNQVLNRLWSIRDRIQTVKSRIRRRELTQVVVRCVHRTIQEMGVVN